MYWGGLLEYNTIHINPYQSIFYIQSLYLKLISGDLACPGAAVQSSFDQGSPYGSKSRLIFFRLQCAALSKYRDNCRAFTNETSFFKICQEICVSDAFIKSLRNSKKLENLYMNLRQMRYFVIPFLAISKSFFLLNTI